VGVSHERGTPLLHTHETNVHSAVERLGTYKTFRAVERIGTYQTVRNRTWSYLAGKPTKPFQLSPFGSAAERIVQQFYGGLVFKAHRPLHHAPLGLRVIKKKKKKKRIGAGQRRARGAQGGGLQGTSRIRNKDCYRALGIGLL